MKTILGLDLGVASIGWAIVKEAENDRETSSIEDCGVRVIPLSSDEKTNFEKGKSYSVCSERTLKRGARRSLQRYKLRRNALLKLLRDENWIDPQLPLTEDGSGTTYQLWELRAQAATEKISLHDFSRVLLTINKKRGYKSSRKDVVDQESGAAIDGIEVAQRLKAENQTPGEFSYELLRTDQKRLPEFYRSDLVVEWDRVWKAQQQYYPNVLTTSLGEQLRNATKKKVWFAIKKAFGLEGKPLTDKQGKKLKRNDERLEKFRLRALAVNEQIAPEHLAIVFQEIIGQVEISSGYLGEISDRSKTLRMEKLTIGQYGLRLLRENNHCRLNGQAFFRQDYIDEFETLWTTQAKFYSQVLNADLKKQIQEIIIFFQRPLRSQKGLISVCEFEGKLQTVKCPQTGKLKSKFVGPRVIPKSNPLFQQFRYWQIINNLEIRNIETRERLSIEDLDDNALTLRHQIAKDLELKDRLKADEIITIMGKNPNAWELNYPDGVIGNLSNFELLKRLKSVFPDQIKITEKAAALTAQVTKVFEENKFDKSVLHLDSELLGQEIENQPSWQLWHLLYSYTGDQSRSGNERLHARLFEKFNFDIDTAKALSAIRYEDDYGSLSSRAIRKILTQLKKGLTFSDACHECGYRHSRWDTKEENQTRELKSHLGAISKNSLRNPVIEKILNQMIHVVNQLISRFGNPAEIRIELARELKKSIKERAEMTEAIGKNNRQNEVVKSEIAKLPQFQSGTRITRNDIIKYKLWSELKDRGYKTLYSDTYIPPEKIFSGDFDVEHIVPKALVFDDSFSNKTLEKCGINREKSNMTAMEFINQSSQKELISPEQYREGVEALYNNGKGISRAKRNKLLMLPEDIPSGFIERDLRNTQYISKKAMEILKQVTREIVPTSGSVTSRLRDDWELVNVLKEINLPIYQQLGLTRLETIRTGQDEGKQLEVATHWSKRDDQRHHAMDALTIAFTKRAMIQYLNHLNARKNTRDEWHLEINKIEKKYLERDEKGKLRFKPPLPINELRKAFRDQLDSVLTSYKAKNKVVTLNKNQTKKKGGNNVQITRTPRGPLHNESIYGRSTFFEFKEEKINAKFDTRKISLVAKKAHREALERRLAEFEGDPKKAFAGKNALSKNPVYLNKAENTKLPEKVRLQIPCERFTIRKPISSDLKIEKVVDDEVKRILEKRLADFGHDAKEAFSNLDANPVWLNESKGIAIKSVTIRAVDQAIPIHVATDHHGAVISEHETNSATVAHVQTSNNHHTAIYQNPKGNFEQVCVSFFEAVQRVQDGKPIIDKDLNRELGWQFLYSIKKNEMFIFPDGEFDPHVVDVLDEKYRSLISPRLFRVQKSSNNDFVFRHHLETTVQRIHPDRTKIDENLLRERIWRRLTSMSALEAANPLKIRLDHLGKIVQTGEY